MPSHSQKNTIYNDIKSFKTFTSHSGPKEWSFERILFSAIGWANTLHSSFTITATSRTPGVSCFGWRKIHTMSLEGGPLLVISRVITPINGLING